MTMMGVDSGVPVCYRKGPPLQKVHWGRGAWG